MPRKPFIVRCNIPQHCRGKRIKKIFRSKITSVVPILSHRPSASVLRCSQKLKIINLSTKEENDFFTKQIIYLSNKENERQMNKF